MRTTTGFKVDAAASYTLSKMLIRLEEPRLFRRLEEIEERLRSAGTSWINETQRQGNEWSVFVGGDGRRLVLTSSARRVSIERLEDPHQGPQQAPQNAAEALDRLLNSTTPDDAPRSAQPIAVEAPEKAVVRPVAPAPPAASVPAKDALGRLIQAVRRWPGSSARELALQMQGDSLGVVSKRDLNPLLYRHRDLFQSQGDSPPRWRLIGNAAPSTPARAARTSARSAAGVARTTPDTYAHLLAAPQPPPAAARVTPAPHRRLDARPLGDLVLPLFGWQARAIRSWYDAGCVGIVEAVTGAGKTHVGLEAVAQAHRDGQKSVVLVPSVELQRQWTRRIVEALPHLRIARVGGEKARDPAKCDVTIAVINSATRTDLSTLSPDSLLVADEVHRYGAETFAMALRLGFKRRLGLTATLERADDAVDDVIRPYFGSTVLTYGFRAAIDEDVVAPFRIVLAPVPLSPEEHAAYDKLSRQISNGFKVLRGAGVLGGDGGGSAVQKLGALRSMPGQVGAAARAAEGGMRDRRKLLSSLSGKLDALEELALTIGDSSGTLIFTESKTMAEEASARLREWDVPASALHSSMDASERKTNLELFETGALRALAAPKLLDEGIDVPAADLGIVMTASRSRRQMIQRLGRVIRRKAPGVTVDFVVMYGADTVEDPEDGAHEGFFDLLLDVAQDPLKLEVGWSAADLGR